MKGFLTIREVGSQRRAIRTSTIKEVREDGTRTVVYTKIGDGRPSSRSIYVRAEQDLDQVIYMIEQ